MTNGNLWDDSPVAESLAIIIQGICDDSQVVFRDSLRTAPYRLVSYREDFPYLWGIGARKTSGFFRSHLVGTTATSLVVVWDGTPEPASDNQNFNIGEWVTVYDWAAALCLSLNSDLPFPKLRLFILDIASTEHPTSFGCRTFPSFAPSLPWVRIYEPCVKDEATLAAVTRALAGDPNGAGLFRRSYHGPRGSEQLFSDLAADPGVSEMPFLCDARVKTVEAIGTLRRAWSNQVTSAPKRHSISNIVAPLVLADGLVLSNQPGAEILRFALQNDPLRSAFAVLLRSLGVLPPEVPPPVPDFPAPPSPPSEAPTSQQPAAEAFVHPASAPVASPDGAPRAETPINQQPPSEVPPESSPPSKALTSHQPAAETPAPECSPDEDEAGASISPLNDPLVEHDLFGRFEDGVRFLLVDDQIELGYHELLACLLFGDKRVSDSTAVGMATTDGNSTLRSIKTPDVLVDWLFRFCSGTGLSAALPVGVPRVVGRSLDTNKATNDAESPGHLKCDDFDILLLDLRLFGFDDASTGAEQRFLQSLVDFYHRAALSCSRADGESGLVDHAVANLHRVAAAAQKRLENLLAPGKHSQAGPEYLLFLPLLLCYVDPSLPIVLFSSTRQRSISQLLAEYPNVITPFAKPFVAPYEDAPTPKSYIDELRSALKAALSLHEARAVWVELAKRAKWLACRPGASEKYSLPELPSKTTKKPPLEYMVRTGDIEHLGREYREIMLRGRFADALMVPGNWLEGLDAEIGKFDTPPDALCKSIAKTCLDAFSGSDEAQLTSGITALCASQAQGPLRSVLEVLKSDYLEKDPPYKAINHLSSWLHAQEDSKFCPEKVAGLGLHGIIPQKPAAVLAHYLSLPNVRQRLATLPSPNWAAALRSDARYAEFAPLRGFRNIRAHYSVRPEDASEVREYAIWCWLWLLSATVPMAPGRMLLDVNVGPFDNVGAHIDLNGYPFIKTGQFDADGKEACREMLVQLWDAIENKRWFRLDDPLLRRALVGLAQVPAGCQPSTGPTHPQAAAATAPAAPPCNAPPNRRDVWLRTTESAKLCPELESFVRSYGGGGATYRRQRISKKRSVTWYHVTFGTAQAARDFELLLASHWLFLNGAYLEVDGKGPPPRGPVPAATHAPTGVKQHHQSRQQPQGGGPRKKTWHKQGKPRTGSAPASQPTQRSGQQKRLPIGSEIDVVVIADRQKLGGAYVRTAKGGIEGRLEWRGISKTQPQPGQRVKAEVINNAPHTFRLRASS